MLLPGIREKKILSLIYGSVGLICYCELPHQPSLKDAPKDRNRDHVWYQMMASLSPRLVLAIAQPASSQMNIEPRYGAISQGDQPVTDNSKPIPLDSFSFGGDRNLFFLELLPPLEMCLSAPSRVPPPVPPLEG